MAGYWPKSLFAFLWTETKWRSIKRKGERGQYPAIFTELAWSIKDLLYGIKGTEKTDLRTCLLSSTEKETSEMLK